MTVWVRDWCSDNFTGSWSVLKGKQNSLSPGGASHTPSLAGRGLITSLSTMFHPDEDDESAASVISSSFRRWFGHVLLLCPVLVHVLWIYADNLVFLCPNCLPRFDRRPRVFGRYRMYTCPLAAHYNCFRSRCSSLHPWPDRSPRLLGQCWIRCPVPMHAKQGIRCAWQETSAVVAAIFVWEGISCWGLRALALSTILAPVEALVEYSHFIALRHG